MFVAKTLKDQYVSTVNSSDYHYLSYVSPPFFCPACHSEVVLKKGTKRRWHFAHLKFSICPSQSEPESKEHLDGKAGLYSWLSQTGVSPRLEVYFSAIARKADVCFNWNQRMYAVEFQCSAISEEEMNRRTRDYLSIGVRPLWIFSADRLKPKQSSLYTVQAFEWTALRERKSDARYAFVYFSSSRSFFYFLFPRAIPSVTMIYADFYSLASTQVSLRQLIDLPETMDGSIDWYHSWSRHKKNWRYRRNIWRNKADLTYLRKVLASLRSDIPFFPSEAGWPVYGMEAFQTPSYVWQSWILLCFLPEISTAHSFRLNDLLQSMFPLIEQNVFETRELPLIASPIETAIGNYLDVLCRLGVIKKSGNEWKKQKNISISSSLDEAYRRDKKLSKRIF